MKKALTAGAAALQLVSTAQTCLSHDNHSSMRKQYLITEDYNPKVYEDIKGLTPDAINTLCTPVAKQAAKAFSAMFGLPGTPTAIDTICDIKQRTPEAQLNKAIDDTREYLLEKGRTGLYMDDAVLDVFFILKEQGITFSPEQAEHTRTYLEQITAQAGVGISADLMSQLVDPTLGHAEPAQQAPANNGWSTDINPTSGDR